MPKLLNGCEEFHIDLAGQVVGSASARDLGFYVASAWAGVKNTANTTVGAATLTAAQLTGAAQVYLVRSGSTAAYSDTTDTAVNIIAALNAIFGQVKINQSYDLCIVNQVAFVDTLVGGTGVTINGTATVPASGTRNFTVTVTSLTTVTIQNVGSGTA